MAQLIDAAPECAQLLLPSPCVFFQHPSTRNASSLQRELSQQASSSLHLASLQRAKDDKKQDEGRTLALLTAVSAPRAWTWKTVLPASPDMELTDTQYRLAARLNLSLKPVDGEALGAMPDACPLCAASRVPYCSLRADPWHFLTCTKMSKGEISTRHDQVALQMRRCAQLLGIRVLQEVEGLDANKSLRPDLLLTLPGRTVLSDVAVCHPLGPGASREWGSGSRKLGTARAREGQKNNKYRQLAANHGLPAGIVPGRHLAGDREKPRPGGSMRLAEGQWAQRGRALTLPPHCPHSCPPPHCSIAVVSRSPSSSSSSSFPLFSSTLPHCFTSLYTALPLTGTAIVRALLPPLSANTICSSCSGPCRAGARACRRVPALCATCCKFAGGCEQHKAPRGHIAPAAAALVAAPPGPSSAHGSTNPATSAVPLPLSSPSCIDLTADRPATSTQASPGEARSTSTPSGGYPHLPPPPPLPSRRPRGSHRPRFPTGPTGRAASRSSARLTAVERDHERQSAALRAGLPPRRVPTSRRRRQRASPAGRCPQRRG